MNIIIYIYTYSTLILFYICFILESNRYKNIYIFQYNTQYNTLSKKIDVIKYF